MTAKQTTGLFFGSFNPIHVGHMVIANYMKAFANMDELWFVVSPQNPFKKHQSISDDRHRLEMVRRAIGDAPGYRASDIEFNMPIPSYTIDTVTYLMEKYPNRRFSLIMGADNLESLHKWKNYNELLKLCPIFVYPRPGSETRNSFITGDITIIDAPLMEISSSFIRQSIANKHDIRFFVPEKVWEYMVELQIYG
jgi:nicotinate-nucleotide adenylyltransferase